GAPAGRTGQPTIEQPRADGCHGVAGGARGRSGRSGRRLLRPRRPLAATGSGTPAARGRARPGRPRGRAVRPPDRPLARQLPGVADRGVADRGGADRGRRRHGGPAERWVRRRGPRRRRPPQRAYPRATAPGPAGVRPGGRGDARGCLVNTSVNTSSTSPTQITDADSPFLAVVGMACRFPDAVSLAEFWTNLTSGRESVSRFPNAPEPAGGNGAAGHDHRGGPAYVPAAGVLDGACDFDAGFFGYSPREALLLDPQQRVFMECAWEAREDAGYDPMSCAGLVGVYAGSSQTSYHDALLRHRDRLGPVSDWQLRLSTGVDFLTTRTAYKLGLTGPAVTLQTACSTSLVAIHV